MNAKVKNLFFNVSIVMAAIVCFSFASVSALAAEEFAGGSGTESDPYLIATKEHLDNVRNDLSAHYKMTADIVFTDDDFAEGGVFYNEGKGWKPIGGDTAPFAGVFDGDGHTIVELYVNASGITQSTTERVSGALFGYTNGATIKNLGMVASDIYAKTGGYSDAYVGGIVGWASDTTILGCYNTGGVVAKGPYANVGGIVGNARDNTTITNCYNMGAVSADGPGAYAGGIVGKASNGTTIMNCYNMGEVDAQAFSQYHSAYAYAGGILGIAADSIISNCYSIGVVTASASGPQGQGKYSGGIAGKGSSSAIADCYYLDVVEEGVSSGADTATKCTITQMKDQSTFVSFDFNTVWTMGDGGLYLLPTLRGVTHIEEGVVLTDFGGGNGTVYSPYLISTKTHLNNVRNCLSACFQMTADIVFTEADFAEGGPFYNGGAGWESIGNATTKFTGTFDGDQHTITGLRQNISASNTAYGGLFGYADGATIKNLGMAESNITVTAANVYAGGVVGRVVNSTISNCCNTGDISATSIATTASTGYSAYAGGIVGEGLNKTTSNCCNTGNVSAEGNSNVYAGGIVGWGGKATNCSNSGTITAYTSHKNTSASSNKYYAYAAGILGYSGTATLCYNAGDVSGYYAGGITAYMYSDNVANCFNRGTVTGARAGGIAGRIEDSSSTIDCCYNVGIISKNSVSSASAGAVAGSVYSTSSISKCYYLDNMSLGIGSREDTSITKKCTFAQMTAQSTFEDFDFEAVWTMDGNADYLYPELCDVPMEFTKRAEYLVVTSMPAKTQYESTLFDSTGLEIAAHYNNGEVVVIDDYELSGYTATVGTNTITVSHMGATVTFTVDVMPKSLTRIEVVPPKKLIYQVGEALNVTGGKVTLCYNNETSNIIDLTADMVSGFDSSTAGTIHITVTYENYSSSFAVEVVNKTLISNTGNTVSVTPYSLPVGSRVLIALYSEGGQQLDSETFPWTEDCTITFESEAIGSSSIIKVFYLDENSRPLRGSSFADVKHIIEEIS